MYRWLLALLILLPGGAAIAAAPAVKTTQGSQQHSKWDVSFVNGDSGDSEAIPNTCGVIMGSFNAATGGAVEIYAVPTSSTATSSGTLLRTWSASSVARTVIDTQYPFLRAKVVTAPSAGTARLYLYCSLEGAGLSGGAGAFADDIRYAEDFITGADWGQAVNSAYADCIADGTQQCIIQLPRDQDLEQSTGIDFCNVTGQPTTPAIPVTLRGHGSNRGGANGTRLEAQSDLRRAVDTGNFDFAAAGSEDGRDEIVYAGVPPFDFLTAGYRRGDFITTTADDVGNTTTQSEMPFVVWRAESDRLVVEGYNGLDAGIINESDVDTDETIQKLAFQIRSCVRNVRIEMLGLAGDSDNDATTDNQDADFGVLFWADNDVEDECSAPSTPYSMCSGNRAATGEVTPTVKLAFFEDGFAIGHNWVSIASTSTNTMGQADHTVVRDSEVGNDSKIAVWADNSQSQPGFLIADSAVNTFEKYGAYSTADGIHMTGIDSISANANCIAGTFGTCAHLKQETANTDDTLIENSIFEITGAGDPSAVAVDGLIFDVDYSTANQKRYAIRDTSILANYDSDTAAGIKMIEFTGAGQLVLDNVRLNTNDIGITGAAPTVVIANPNQATRPLYFYGNAWTALSGSATVRTVTTLSNDIQNRWELPFTLKMFSNDITTHTAGNCMNMNQGNSGGGCTVGNTAFLIIPRAISSATLQLRIGPGVNTTDTTSCDVTLQHGTPASTTAVNTSAILHYGRVDLDSPGETASATITAAMAAGDWIRVAAATDADSDCITPACSCVSNVGFMSLITGVTY